MNYLHQINEATANASIVASQMRMMPQTQQQKLLEAGSGGYVVGSSLSQAGQNLRNTQLTDNTKVSKNQQKAGGTDASPTSTAGGPSQGGLNSGIRHAIALEKLITS